MSKPSLFLVFGATGGTGKHFVNKALQDGHKVRVLVRSPHKLGDQAKNLDVWEGSLEEPEKIDTNKLCQGVDYVCAMVGDRERQQSDNRIVFRFMEKLVPSMREQGVKRFLYQAGGLSRPYQGSLGIILGTIRYTIARSFNGQHEDNEAVMEYLETKARDLDWIVHRAGIGSDGASKGTLGRSTTSPSIGTHIDSADYNYRQLIAESKAAIHTSDLSNYSSTLV
ncbi:uncharacterized protein L201_006996 [Kwoniella dendrophila CBS 6074]|uniref:NAD(P)-binding domain-containing protein n=1 Tax=Kwoniella dendrophila CBS 6074 TaxID=1295534 RepID=A0AAX4K374_9TREE